MTISVEALKHNKQGCLSPNPVSQTGSQFSPQCSVSVYNFMFGRLHTLLTAAFFQVKFEHLVFDMIGLYVFGRNIGRVFGAEFLLKLYLAGAIGGSVFYLVHHGFLHLTTPSEGRTKPKDPYIMPGLGANGAVNAIMLLDIFLHPKVPLMLLAIFLIGKDIRLIMEVPAEKSVAKG